MRGVFITLEGPEGSGKTTQSAKLVEHLRSMSREVVSMREPGGTPTGEAIREILQHNSAGEAIALETEVLLFAASRAQLVRKILLPALERGACVVCDRFSDSTLAYQGYGRGFDLEQMIAINSFATAGIQPDVTVLLDLDIATGFDRLLKRNEAEHRDRDRFEKEEVSFHESVRAGYLELAKRWPKRFVVVSSLGEVDAVAGEIWDVLAPRLGVEAE
ncbi:MAG: dTMP kinase [Lentisphaerae bacterium]|nr:dTMP kinase [Lentisphaerota bacterium]